jgi:hypothetical protein
MLARRGTSVKPGFPRFELRAKELRVRDRIRRGGSVVVVVVVVVDLDGDGNVNLHA